MPTRTKAAYNEKDGYAFCLDAIERKYAYFRTISFWTEFGSHSRDIRQADLVIGSKLQRILTILGLQPFAWLRNDHDLVRWRNQLGWILVPPTYAEKRLKPLLDSRTCVKSPLGLFWDVTIPRNRATSRRVPPSVREQVLKRDRHRCVHCGRRATPKVKLTMDHVIPFSRGGETSAANLVTLCECCNQDCGNEHHSQLFELAKLQYGWDPELVKTKIPDVTADTLACAMYLSNNIMVSRFQIDQFPDSASVIRRATR